MANRNFSMIDYFNKRAAEWEPLLAFKGKTKRDWQNWRRKALKKYLELLGEFPEKVPLRPDVIYSIEEDGIIRERVVFDSEKYMSVPCYVLKPADMPSDGKQAAILCSHGHGLFGKEPVAGNKTSPELRQSIEIHNYNYGERMARAGFLTISPCLRVFGERADAGVIGERETPYPGRDKCNVHFIRGMIMGIYTLMLNIWDFKCCIDYLETRPEVDKNRIGMMGLSQGGTMTCFTTAAEPRIKAADIIGYGVPFELFGVQDANFCGSQVVPDIYKYLDTTDVAGLIAPRPLLFEMGVQDTCFPIEDSLKGYEAIRKIYRAAGAEDKLVPDMHPGPHAFAANKAFDFFRKNL
jgi:dienelactone hydrolase